MESPRDEVFLVILNLDHFSLYGLVGDELVDEDRLGLTETMDPVEALPLQIDLSYSAFCSTLKFFTNLAGRVPGRIQQEKMVGSGEIQSDSSGLNYIKVRQSDMERC